MSFLPENGNTVSHMATIQPAAEQDIIEFELLLVSAEPGVALNFGTQTGNDLVLRQEDQIDPNVEVTSPTTAVATLPAANAAGMTGRATVVTRSLDPGAYGVLRTRACFLDPPGSMVVDVNIPRDDDGNRIADGWAHNAGAATDDLDDDPPGNGINGDFLSLYEEYRGFYVQGVHHRTNPWQKDVFICDVDALGPGDFTSTNVGARVHYINADEWDADRRINGNSWTAHIHDQKAIKVVNAGSDMNPFVWGQTSLIENPAIPINVASACGYPENIGGHPTQTTQRISADGTTIPVQPGEGLSVRVPTFGYRPAGGLTIAAPDGQVELELFGYTSVSQTSFLEVVRGERGTTAVPHAAGSIVSAFTDPRDFIRRTFAHQVAQAVGFWQSPNPPLKTCDGVGENIMSAPACAGSTDGNGYWHGLPLGQFAVRYDFSGEGEGTGRSSGGADVSALSLPPSFGSADQGPLALQLALERSTYTQGETATAGVTSLNDSDAPLEVFAPPACSLVV